MARGLHRLGMLAARRKWVFLGAWVVLVAVLIGASKAVGSNTSNNLRLPGTDSQAASDLLAARFPPQQNGSNPLVFHVRTGKVTDANAKQAIEASYTTVKKLPHVAAAVDPFSQRGAAQVSKDRQTAFIPVLLDVGGDELNEEIAQNVLDAGDPARKAGMQVAVGGSVGAELSEPATESSEVIGLAAAMIILAFTFGTLVAMGLPILSAVFGLAAGLSLIVLLGHVVTVPSIAPTLATMIGLGVGIDYALLLVSRHRQNRGQGMTPDESIAMAVATSGSAIVFAGTTVVIALLTLIVAGIPLVTALGYSSAVAVVTAVLASITLLLAVLSVVGRRIDSLRLPSFLRPKPKGVDRGFWGGWARAVTSRPWLAIAAVLALLIPLIIPFLALKLGQEDVGATPKSTTERQAYDLMAAGFGVGYNGPLLVAVKLGQPPKPSSEYTEQQQQAQSLQKQLQQEQKQGTAQKQDLTTQADALTAQSKALTKQQQQLEQQQGSLKSEQSSLERQAAADSKEQAQLQASANRLEAEQVALNSQIAATGSQAQKVVRDGAKVTKELTSVVRQITKNRADQRKVEAQLNRAKNASQKAKLQAKLRGLEDEETRLEKRLDTLVRQEQANREQSQALLAQARSLREQEVSVANRALALTAQAAALATDAAKLVQERQALVEQASNLQVQAAKLQTQAANLNTQAAQLQTQQVELQGEQQTAQGQQQQAEQLKSELTNELTKAGGDARGTDPRLVDLQNALAATDGVDVVSPPQINKAGNAATFTVIATTTPAAPATADLVKTLRTYVIPQATHGTDLDAFVGGQTASYVDLADGISSRLLLVIAVVIGLSFCILLMAFRSFLFAAQAAVANVLSVTAAFGVLTAVFQKGWGLSLVGLDTASGTDPIASYVPLMMFTVLFGLSMDYQVFLISKIEQYRHEGSSDRDAIRRGLAGGARVIVAAALIMISVFGSFILNADPTVKQFGVGLSVGVALAAVTVLAFAPAVLVLAGRGSWWVPAWLDRVLPHVDVEGAGAEATPVAAMHPSTGR
ncbi:MAG TPA: MMPL family transporter [Gaiellaceae bacterium]